MIYFADLHTHTTRSDGNDLPAELIQNAEKAGVSVIGIADHDILPPEKIEINGREVSLCEYASTHHVSVLSGVEFSCQTRIEDVHIVGYACDFNSESLIQLTNEISKNKVMGYLELLQRLTEQGMPLSVDEVLATVPSMNLADLQKKRIFDLLAQKGYAQDWKTAKLMIRSEPALQIERKKPDAIQVIKLLHAAGGLAILAHPFLIDSQIDYEGYNMSRWEFIEILIKHGLDGIEYRYPYDKTTCLDHRSNDTLWYEIREKYAGRLFFSAGSDYHNDARKGVKNGRMIGECGLTKEEYDLVPVKRTSH